VAALIALVYAVLMARNVQRRLLIENEVDEYEGTDRVYFDGIVLASLARDCCI
jgi:hypothetical protein